jgi:hypothetical protein
VKKLPEMIVFPGEVVNIRRGVALVVKAVATANDHDPTVETVFSAAFVAHGRTIDPMLPTLYILSQG